MTTRHLHHPDEDGTVDVGHYGRVLRGHKRLLMLGTVLGLLVGGLAAQAAGASYTAETQILVKAIGVADGGLASDGGVNIATQRQIASSTAVAERVQDALGSEDTPRQLLSGLVVAFPANSSVLSFTYSAPDPATAQERAQAFADAYLELRRDQGARDLEGLVSSTEDRIATLRTELVTARQAVADAPEDSDELQDATARQDLLLAEIAQLQSRLGELNTLSVEPGDVIEPAALPPAGGELTRVLLVVSVGFLGLLLAAMTAFLLARANKRVRLADDAEREVQLPVLASLEERRVDGSGDVAYEALAVRLLVAARDTTHHTIVLTAPRNTEDARDLSTALAQTIARRGLRVVLVDAGDAASAPVTGTTGAGVGPQTVRLTAGDGRALGTDQIRRVLAEARIAADVVLVAAPPALVSADALLLAVEGDVVVLVAATGVSQYEELERSAGHIDEVGASVLGMVLLPAAGKSSRRAGAAALSSGARALPATEPVRTR